MEMSYSNNLKIVLDMKHLIKYNKVYTKGWITWSALLDDLKQQHF